MAADFTIGALYFVATFLIVAASQFERDAQNVLHSLLQEDHHRCSSVDFDNQRLVCEIWDASDEREILYAAASSGPEQHCSSLLPGKGCPDGSWNQTCMPTEISDEFLCLCLSAKKLVSTPYSWDGEWRDLEGPTLGLFRELCDATKVVCISREYRLGIAHLVKYIQLPDDQITNSSHHTEYHTAKRARIDNYYTPFCSWMALEEDPDKWLQFDLLKPYVALGFLLRNRCEKQLNRVTLVRMAFSADEYGWEFTSADPITPDYRETKSYPTHASCTHWFSHAITARYWRLHILEYNYAASAKVDIIGPVPVLP